MQSFKQILIALSLSAFSFITSMQRISYGKRLAGKYWDKTFKYTVEKQTFKRFRQEVRIALARAQEENPRIPYAELCPELYQLASSSYSQFLEDIDHNEHFRHQIVYEITANRFNLARSDHADFILRTMIAHGFDVNSYERHPHYSPLIQCAQNFSDLQNVSIVRTLLENGATVNIESMGQTPLLFATRNAAVAIVQLLIEHHANVDQQSEHSLDTPLHNASTCGYQEIVSCLLANRANPNIVNGDKKTPLMIAVIKGYKEIVELLIAHGADITVQLPALEDNHHDFLKKMDLLEKPMALAGDNLIRNHSYVFDARNDGKNEPFNALLAQYHINIGTKSLLDLALENHHHEIAEHLRAHGVQ